MLTASSGDTRGRSHNIRGGGGGGGGNSDGNWCVLNGVDGGGSGWDGGWDHDNRGGGVWGDDWHDGGCG